MQEIGLNALWRFLDLDKDLNFRGEKWYFMSCEESEGVGGDEFLEWCDFHCLRLE